MDQFALRLAGVAMSVVLGAFGIYLVTIGSTQSAEFQRQLNSWILRSESVGDVAATFTLWMSRVFGVATILLAVVVLWRVIFG